MERCLHPLFRDLSEEITHSSVVFGSFSCSPKAPAAFIRGIPRLVWGWRLIYTFRVAFGARSRFDTFEGQQASSP